MNGNGNGDHDQGGTPLEIVVQRLVEQQAVEITEAASAPESPEDLVHGWKRAQHPPTLEQLHAGLLSVSQIAEAAIEMGVHISADIRGILPTLQQVSTQLQEFSAELRSVQNTLMTFKRDIQSLKEDTRDMTDTVRSIPGIKLMLTEVLTRLPDQQA